MQFKFQRTQCIEIDIPAANTQTKFVFPDQPQLTTSNNGNPVRIDSIISYNSDSLSYSPITFQQVMASNDQKSGFLTLYQGDLATINALPLINLSSVSNVLSAFNGGVQDTPLMRNLINISWTKSFIQFGVAPTGSTKIVLCVYYTVFATFEEYANSMLSE